MAKAMTVVNPTAMKDVLHRLEAVASESALRQASVAGARVVHEAVVARAPVGKKAHKRAGKEYPAGTLKKSIFVVYDEDDSVRGVRASYLVGIAREAFYWRFKEWGSSRQAADPFFHPAYDASRGRAADAINKVLERKVAEALKR
ncbi:HK97-gp10 family putative phage morphogenesis protein [Achromobacter sp.]|uniref:HK97-gp10 family putative phage morphogenesis protein n=1 Tax=Achromobacter sp. TaxID=134375 RepID=UPI000EEE9718|nr:HK97-gp10 family putative phage morphogenesis protein [Achromobacter sp.]HCW18358.1 hypothetical protein [Achromobacter sp.]